MVMQNLQPFITFRPIENPSSAPSSPSKPLPLLVRPVPTRPPRCPTWKPTPPEKSLALPFSPISSQPVSTENDHDLLSLPPLDHDQHQEHDLLHPYQRPDHRSTPISSSFCLGSSLNPTVAAVRASLSTGLAYHGRRIKSFPDRPLTPAPTALTDSLTMVAGHTSLSHVDGLGALDRACFTPSDTTCHSGSATPTPAIRPSLTSTTESIDPSCTHSPPSPSASSSSSASSQRLSQSRQVPRQTASSSTPQHRSEKGIRLFFGLGKHARRPSKSSTSTVSPTYSRAELAAASSPDSSFIQEAVKPHNRNSSGPASVKPINRPTFTADRAEPAADDEPSSLPSRRFQSRVRRTSRRASLDFWSALSREPKIPASTTTPDRPERRSPLPSYAHLQSFHTIPHSTEFARHFTSYSELSQDSLLSDLSWESSGDTATAQHGHHDRLVKRHRDALQTSTGLPAQSEQNIVEPSQHRPAREKSNTFSEDRCESETLGAYSRTDVRDAIARESGESLADRSIRRNRDSSSCTNDQSAQLSKPRRMLSLSLKRRPPTWRKLKFSFGSSSAN